jgi:hypothetical protein
MAGDEELRQELERLKRENETLRTKRQQPGDQLRVSAKGGVSVYGLRRFPITFYADEWETLLGMSDRIRAFIRDNRSKLSFKNKE